MCGQGRVFRAGLAGMGVCGGVEEEGFAVLLGSGADSGVVFVGAAFIISVIRAGTAGGVTLSIRVKDGSSSTVVDPSTSAESGTGMLQAESMSF